MQSVLTMCNAIVKNKKNERFEIILEPLQALIQIACLGFYPVGSKVNIYNNLLFIQGTCWSQSISRTYYNDSKDDLFYLFNAVVRFNKFYKNMDSIEGASLFELIKTLACNGIDNLIQTYQQVDNPALLHTLKMYKLLLDNKNSETELELLLSNTSISSENQNIDDIFINITKLYSKSEFHIIYNTLKLMKENPQNYIDYNNSLYYILNPINNKIKKWINDNIVF